MRCLFLSFFQYVKELSFYNAPKVERFFELTNIFCKKFQTAISNICTKRSRRKRETKKIYKKFGGIKKGAYIWQQEKTINSMNTKTDIYLSILIDGVSEYYRHYTGKEVSFAVNRPELDQKAQDIATEARLLSLGHTAVPTKKPMRSILECIEKDDWELRKYMQPAVPVMLSKKFFAAEGNAQQDYAALWSSFNDELSLLNTTSKTVYAETLLNLLYKYAVNIPASETDLDVSVYDYLRTAAAVSVCLNEDDIDSDNPFLLIGADVSGIQKFIYQIISKYAAKNLKGRSFYLRLLTDAIVRYLLRELGLLRANIVYNSGGGFYIIAPNTENIRQKLQKAVDFVEKQLFDTHGTILYVAIDSIAFGKDVFTKSESTNNNLADIWGKLFVKRDSKKNARFSSMLENDYTTFFNPDDKTVLLKHDAITGEPIPEGQQRTLDTKKKDEKPTVRTTTKAQIELGQKLKNTRIIVVADIDKDLGFGYEINPCGLGIRYSLIDDEKTIAQNRQFIDAFGSKISIVVLNGLDDTGNCVFVSKNLAGNNILALEFYGGNNFDNTTFERMCDPDKSDDDSFKRLGVLRMDVDNLGRKFQSGIPKKLCTLPRYAALSRSFDYFFSGYLNRIQSDQDPQCQQSFIVYSGGDDVFVVAEWNIAIKIAEQIREDFRIFTCNNDKFSISGGVAIIKAKFPIMKGAEQSDEEEKNAKKHGNKTEKNSISFMQTPLDWDIEFPLVRDKKDEIIAQVKDSNDLSRSFIGKVLSHCASAEIKEENGVDKVTNFKTYWQITYDLGRLKEGKKDDVKDFLTRCVNECCTNDTGIYTKYHALELWAMACRWADLETRSATSK